jgi:hypothetical protein
MPFSLNRQPKVKSKQRLEKTLKAEKNCRIIQETKLLERIQDFPYKTQRILWKRLSFKYAKIISNIDVPIKYQDKKEIVAKSSW